MILYGSSYRRRRETKATEQFNIINLNSTRLEWYACQLETKTVNSTGERYQHFIFELFFLSYNSRVYMLNVLTNKLITIVYWKRELLLYFLTLMVISYLITIWYSPVTQMYCLIWHINRFGQVGQFRLRFVRIYRQLLCSDELWPSIVIIFF